MRGRKSRHADQTSGDKSGNAEESAVALSDDAGATTGDPDEEQKAPTESIKSPELAKTEQEKAPQIDLDALGRDLERSLGGGTEAAAPAPPPPDMNATPEDILGVPTHRVVFEPENVKPPEPAAAPASEVPKTASGPQPMDEYEEHAQMANEVLRATSDQPRGANRRARNAEEGSGAGESEGEEPAPENEGNVRFSEDLTISSRSSRKRRKIFGR
jgi:hypothetical protein